MIMRSFVLITIKKTANGAYYSSSYPSFIGNIDYIIIIYYIFIYIKSKKKIMNFKTLNKKSIQKLKIKMKKKKNRITEEK